MNLSRTATCHEDAHCQDFKLSNSTLNIESVARSTTFHFSIALRPSVMPSPTNTLIVEGTLEELADELAVYIDNLRKEGEPIQPQVNKLLQEGEQEDALKVLVGSSAVLNVAPEKGMPTTWMNFSALSLTWSRVDSCLQSPHSYRATNTKPRNIHREDIPKSHHTNHLLTGQRSRPTARTSEYSLQHGSTECRSPLPHSPSHPSCHSNKLKLRSPQTSA